METVLTLNIDKSVVYNAEKYAQYSHKTVSQLVEDYLLSISSKNVVDIDQPLGPITRQLAGIIPLEQDIDYKELLTDSLMEKYL
ncbi:MAG: DUF6364 family protein [Treponema sp.]|jgi:hypothetical protein|nr:DUF6364 family protein [Treponema sp.]